MSSSGWFWAVSSAAILDNLPFLVKSGHPPASFALPREHLSLLRDVSAGVARSTLPDPSVPGALHTDSTAAPNSVGPLRASVTKIEKVNSHLSKNREFNGRYNLRSAKSCKDRLWKPNNLTKHTHLGECPTATHWLRGFLIMKLSKISIISR